MSPIASAARRRASVRRAPAVAVLALLAAVPGLPAAHAEPPQRDSWVYEFADFAASPAATDYDHRTVTLTGTLLRRPRRGGPEEPAPAEAVELVTTTGGSASGADGTPGAGGDDSDSADGAWGTDGPGGADGEAGTTVVTDALGGFQWDGMEIGPPAERGGATGPFTVEVRAVHRGADDSAQAGDAPEEGTADARLTVVATPSTARLAVDYLLDAAAGTVTALGSVARDTPMGPLPVAGVAVRLEYRTPVGAPLVEEEVTGSDGRFSVVFPASGGGTVSAAVSGQDDPYLEIGGTDGAGRNIVVPPPGPTATATSAVSAARSRAPSAHRTTATPSSTRARPAPTESAAAAPKPVPADDGRHILAETGGGSTRAAFLTGGTTLLLAGLLLMVVRRRMRLSE